MAPSVLFIGPDLPPAVAPLAAAAVNDLEAALDRIAEGGIDAVLMDVAATDTLGGMAPGKLADMAPQIPVVLWTSRDREAEALERVPLGVVDVVVAENASTDALETCLGAVAARHEARRRLETRAAALNLSPERGETWHWEADTDLRFTWLSRNFSLGTGLDPSAVRGATPWDMDALDQSAEGWQRCREDAEARRPLRNILCSVRDGRGQVRAFRINGSPTYAPDGTFTGYAGTGTDATREVEHSVRLAKAHERLMDSHETLEKFRERLEEDLGAARRMQRELLPSPDVMKIVEQRYGVTLESVFETSDELGGDIWGLAPIDDHRFAIYIADFSGHGVSAALNTFRLHAIIENMVHGRENPGGYLQAINTRLAGLLPTGQYATVLYGVVDVVSNLLIYAAAAAPAPLFVAPDTGDIRTADGAGLPLGITKSAAYETRTVPFPPGELMFLYSDALTECGRENGKDLGKDGLQDLLSDAIRRGGPETGLESILGPFNTRVTRPLTDDLTVVRCLRRPRP